MARNPNDVAKDMLGNVMMQIITLTVELEQVREELEQLKLERAKASEKNGSE